ncbi:MAG: hypothetical protein N2506_07035 [Dehalococcoidales bacterium]|nr:hypothetical protein [Dehalococcoidales bacterium]
MPVLNLESLKLTESDLDFIVRAAAPESADRERLKRLIQTDDDFRKAVIGDERVFRRVMDDEEVFLKISPALYFEVLLRRTLEELKKTSHTVEKIGGERVPVFDTAAVIGLLSREPVLEYLADMLASFTRTESYTIPVRVKKGIWRRLRFSDMDIDALSHLSETTDEENRFAFYKRIADICLFILGIFPEYAQFDYRYPGPSPAKPKLKLGRRGVQDYEEDGRKFYRLAAEQVSARALDLSRVLWLLHENFSTARKPLNFISQHYFAHRKKQLFGI